MKINLTGFHDSVVKLECVCGVCACMCVHMCMHIFIYVGYKRDQVGKMRNFLNYLAETCKNKDICIQRAEEDLDIDKF